MDSVKGNMEEMKDKMDQLTRAITNMLARETETDKRKATSTSTPQPGDVMLYKGLLLQWGGAKDDAFHPKGSTLTLAHNGASHPVQIPILQENYVGLSQQYEEDYPTIMVEESKPITHSAATIWKTRTEDKYRVLEERLKVIEGFSIFGVDAMGMERIENGLKSGKIGKPSSNQHNNKRYSKSNNSKKGKTNTITTEWSSQMPYNSYIVVVGPNQYPQQTYSRPQAQQPRAPLQQNQQNGYAQRD
ncbi:hypothetical protein KIW84_045426 [Lathyrus oleraceus]|uniref:Uncharacterized protein n=1 Tax=Pisum sativum TaxID=3888 RepID=A0A9D4XL43_PEA|nr:hypothetical protein KIW84_045426 [Pisum sativum]